MLACFLNMPLLFEDFANVFFINVSLLCNESAKWRAQRAHMPYMPYVLYVPYVSTRLTCPTCPRAQVYFTDRKIKKWKLCTHTFLRVLSLILDLNFRNYRLIQSSWHSPFRGTHKRKIPNRVFLLQQTYFLQH